MTDIFKGIPSRVRVSCFTYIVTVGTKHEHTGTHGWNSLDEKIISLSPQITTAEQLANTFIHEVIHAIHASYGLVRHPEEEQPTEEDYTTYTANGLCAFWQDNPEVVKWWQKTVNARP